jgi:hypothetical protein
MSHSNIKEQAKIKIVEIIKDNDKERGLADITNKKIEEFKTTNQLVKYIIEILGINISPATCRKGIYELEYDNIIVNDRKYGYIISPVRDKAKEESLIMRMANQIKITPIRATEIRYFAVSDNMAEHVAEALNKEFCWDIYVVPMKNLIMCMDIEIPGETRGSKRHSLEKRVRDKLKMFEFKIGEIKEIKAEIIDEREMAYDDYKKYHELNNDNNSGGKILKERKIAVPKKKAEID